MNVTPLGYADPQLLPLRDRYSDGPGRGVPTVSLASLPERSRAYAGAGTREVVVIGDEERLLELNRHTFDAESRPLEPIEGKAWDAFLSETLADVFIGRRGRPSLPHQDRDAFLAFAREANDARRTIVGEPVLWFGGDLGVVVSDVRLGEDDTVRFRNVKVFTRRPMWQCVYWQVTPYEPAAS